MTDSGTFQSYVYGDVAVDPLEIVRFQRDIGSDIGTILDIFGTPDQTPREAQAGVDETLARAQQSIPEKGDMLLACPVQGSIYPTIRESCARSLSMLDADIFPIGGVVPLMENQRYPDLVRCILASKKGLDPSKPVHLFGAGHPVLFPLAVALGCDFFDSSAYAKYAADGRMIFPWGTEKLADLSELPCGCPVCSAITAKELQGLEEQERIKHLAIHNLSVSFTELKTIRAALQGGWLWELVEQRAACNPYLSDALRELRAPTHMNWLERQEPSSKKTAVFYTGPHTIHRPGLYRYHTRLATRYKHHSKTTVVFPEGRKPYSMFYHRALQTIRQKKNVNLIVHSHLGPVPIELDEMYPCAQSVFPEVTDRETEEYVTRLLKRFLQGTTIISWDDADTKIILGKTKPQKTDVDVIRIAAVADMQFGLEASEALLKGKVQIIKSKKTGKIRNILCKGEHVLSMRAEDGLFTLKLAGAQRLHKALPAPRLRVVIDDDAVPFVRDGKSVFAQFVTSCDPDLRPYDECIIVDKTDALVAVGQAMMISEEMHAFHHGMAVKTRESFLP